ncbi:hypothetical protein FLAG1_01186 [Fusarium langsethiae]|uniref:Uncharacterized protein n=1 Tax=Fusarium langsethiae TaxID=179993 RepID=A0A0M9F4W9_FUSLA|nr:hypothetical protein FLAG1_01186 [Fusarium langsethiae]GKT99125.1 unnamed protein product [Fusarium langsethiae]GKU17470.1 unnamed protein product [Fusarium langsethiae]
MVKRLLSDDDVARKRHKPIADYHQPQFSPRTTDWMHRLHNQSIYETAKNLYNRSQNLQAKGDAKLREMLPTSDGRDMKYEHFTPVQQQPTGPKTFNEAIATIRELEWKEMLLKEENMGLREKCDKQTKTIQDLNRKDQQGDGS